MAPSQAQTSTSGSRMTHSLSTPSGVDGSASTVNRGTKKLAIRVQMLDDSITLFQVQVKQIKSKENLIYLSTLPDAGFYKILLFPLTLFKF